ncbi:DNA-directed RNA polymerase subunit beta' [Frankliniella fusca]|uniref:DNA-directed RNA polymerase subunit beta n=1 Tax=Frankliniella fusca TaxID=407009 RepID=A0AAE1L8B3_9NEOP|nr:DNA-directed RNA polymerase subunit beta' [Frankliniella fusca]
MKMVDRLLHFECITIITDELHPLRKLQVLHRYCGFDSTITVQLRQLHQLQPLHQLRIYYTITRELHINYNHYTTITAITRLSRHY